MGIFEKEREQLLSYDGHAFLYFALCMLTVILLPWTWYLMRCLLFPRPPPELDFETGGLKSEDSRVKLCGTSLMQARRHNAQQIAKRRRFRGIIKVQLVGAAIGWALLFWVLWEMKGAPTELRTFDPYDILGVQRGAELREIKKAYHTKSLQHHPDKDKDNPLAPVLFQQVSKAYAALTDDAARKNYEKYGNPDGPVQMKMGIALHPKLLVKENQIFTLCMFFAVLFVVPFSIVCCCLRGSNISSNGVCGETLKVFHSCIDIEVADQDMPGLFAASVESRRQICADLSPMLEVMIRKNPEPMKPGSVVQFVQATGSGEEKGRRGVLRNKGPDGRWEVEVWPVTGPPKSAAEVQTKVFPQSVLAAAEPRISCPFSDPSIRRGTAVLWAHMWRLHPHMPPAVQAELTGRLMHLPKLGRAMTSIAAHGEGDRSGFVDVVRSSIKFQRCLVQAMDFDDSPLLQLPHVRSVPANPPTLREVVESCGEASLLRRIGNFSAEQVLDIQAFCRHAPLVELSYVVEVNDEPDMAEGDLGTLKITLTRTNLDATESVGAVHAPLFPGVKFEEWWLLVYDNRGRRMIATDLVLGTGRECKSNVTFIVPRPGDFSWTVHAMCDSYAGLDVQCDVHFRAAKKNEVDRSIFVHPEDAEIRTLFEELMLGLDQEQESDSEEEEEPASREQQMQKREAKKVDSKEPESASEVSVPENTAKEPSEPKEPKAGDGGLSDDEDEEERAVPEGVFVRVVDTTGTFLYREPDEDPSKRVGSVPRDTVLRGFVEGRPDGWMEMATGTSQGVWVKLDGALKTDQENAVPGQPVERLAGLTNLSLCDLVKAHAPVVLLKRWIRHATKEVTAEDMLQVREIDVARARFLAEDLLYRRLGADKFSKLLDEADVLTKKFQTRIQKARGFFQTANGIIWHVTPDGEVKGLHADGSRIRDRVRVAPDDTLQIGPFRLDETRGCHCIHWLRKDDPDKSWNWSRDNTLRTRVRLATGERA